MSTGVASDFETPRPSHRGGAEKAAIVAAKLFVTGRAFGTSRGTSDWHQVSSAARPRAAAPRRGGLVSCYSALPDSRSGTGHVFAEHGEVAISPATEDAQVGISHLTGCHKMLTKLTVLTQKRLFNFRERGHSWVI
jgi:hypothetical protein